MTDKELLYITTIAEYGNITKASERLYIAQPTLSRYIQRLEATLGVELFKRTTEGLKITYAGELYVQTAYKILNEYKILESKLSAESNLMIGRLTVGTTSYLGSIILPHLLGNFEEKYANIDLSIIESLSYELENELTRGSLDLAIMHSPITDESLGAIYIGKEPFMLAVPKGDELNNHTYTKEGYDAPFIDIKLAKDKYFVLSQTTQRTRKVANRIFHNANIEPKIKYITKVIQTASRLACECNLLTIVPRSYTKLFKDDVSPNYYYIEDEYNPYWDIVIAYNKEMQLSRIAKKFIEVSKEVSSKFYT